MNLQNYKLNLRNDYVFKMLHYVNQEIGKEIFASIVEAFTGLKAESVTFAPTDLYAFDPAGKDVRYDLNAKINIRNAIDLEMQVHHMDAVPDRAGYYAAMLYVNQNNKGEEYDLFVNAQSIFLCAQDVYPSLEGCCHEFMMKDHEYGMVLTEKMKAHIIELNKGVRKIDQNKEVSSLSLQEKWMLFLMKYEENTQDSMVLKLLEEEIFRKAKEVLHMISEDARVRERAFARERFIRDQAQMRRENERILKAAEIKFKEAEKMTTEAEKMTREAEKITAEAEEKIKVADKTIEAADKKIKEADKTIEAADKKIKEADKMIEAADKKIEAADKKIEAAEQIAKAAERKTKAAERKTKDAERKIQAAERKEKDANETIHWANEIIKDFDGRVIKEKEDSIIEMLKDGASDSLIMKYLHCSQQQIDMIKKKL